MKIKILSVILLFAFCKNAQAQISRYLVLLKDKNGTPHTFANPSTYLSQKAIDRRTFYNIAIDSTDLPVTPSYISQIANTPNTTILNVSKWQNAIAIKVTDPNAISTINAYPFVKSISGIAAKPALPNQTGNKKFLEEKNTTPVPIAQKTNGITGDYFNYGTNSFAEIHLHNGEFLHNIGLRGQTMQIAMLDNGFRNFTTLDAFDSIIQNNQVKDTWDFVHGETNVADDGSHGMSCFSTIGANIPGQFIGKAPKANFLLYKTEDDASEYPIEEFNWVCGAERADSAGADVISSSLGYYAFDNTSFNHTYADMDGNTTMAANGADMAAKKGLLIFIAVGNEGNSAWKYLITPSDADSVLAVGAVNTGGFVGGFSSYGPSADGRIKPDVASIGVSAMIQTTGNTVSFSNGTSFACPNMAGLGTCLWQGFPEFNNMKILKALQEAGNKFATPDTRTGYGIPDMKLAFANLLTDYATASATFTNCVTNLQWHSKDVAAMQYEIERKGPNDTAYTKIETIAAQGQSVLTNMDYSYNNSLVGLPAGVYTYRIRQIIDTSSAGFMAIYLDSSSVASTTFCENPNPDESFPEKIMVQPNPVNTQIIILKITTPYLVNQLHIQIYDSKGSLVLQKIDSKNIGTSTVNIPVHQLARGLYFIQCYNDDKKLIGTAKALLLQ